MNLCSLFIVAFLQYFVTDRLNNILLIIIIILFIIRIICTFIKLNNFLVALLTMCFYYLQVTINNLICWLHLIAKFTFWIPFINLDQIKNEYTVFSKSYRNFITGDDILLMFLENSSNELNSEKFEFHTSDDDCDEDTMHYAFCIQ